jgi:hypothetical protein
MKLRGRVAVYTSCDKQDYTLNFSKVLYWKHIRTMCLHIATNYMQLNDIICKIIETVKVQTNYTHSMFAQNFAFGQACFVNQYHYE